MEYNGTTILDVADPKNPVLVTHIKNDVRANSRSVQVVEDYFDGEDYLIRNHEAGEVNKFEIFKITDRANPVKVAEVSGTPAGPLTFAHKGWWSQDSGLFYAAVNEPGFTRGAHMAIWDLSNPYQPEYVSSWWMPGQKASDDAPPVNLTLHHPNVTHADETGVPFPVETWQVPNGDYLLKGGRFGPYQFAETKDGQYHTFDDKIVWVPYFNAGARVVDITDPYNIKEVGYYVPEATERSRQVSVGQPADVIQINDIDLDANGLAYCSDRVGNGLFILQYMPYGK